MWYMLPAQPATTSAVAPVVRPADGAEVYWCKSECAQLLLGTNAMCVRPTAALPCMDSLLLDPQLAWPFRHTQLLLLLLLLHEAQQH